MPLRSDWSQRACPIARSLDVVGDPWVLLILREAFVGTRRFDEFRDILEISDTVLSRRLQAMVDADLLRRVPYRAEQRTHHEYVLTEAGEDLLPVLHGLLLWGERHRSRGEGSGQLTIVHRGCGQVTASPDTCSQCGRQLSAHDVDWHRPWRAPELTPLVPAPQQQEAPA